MQARAHRMLKMPLFVLPKPLDSFISFFLTFGASQIFQNFKFSSPAAVHTSSPFGLSAENSTRESCASLISATFSIDG